MEKEIFEKLVQEGISAIPEKFVSKLENVAIVVEAEPTAQQREKLKLRENFTLFGLYEGVPQTKRGPNYGMTLPDKITIFQQPIEQYAHSEEEIKKIVCDTVWHEIAHHFGSDEQRVREAQKKMVKN